MASVGVRVILSWNFCSITSSPTWGLVEVGPCGQSSLPLGGFPFQLALSLKQVMMSEVLSKKDLTVFSQA